MKNRNKITQTPEYLPMRVNEVIDDIKECTEAMVQMTARLNDIIIMLSAPILIVKEK